MKLQQRYERLRRVDADELPRLLPLLAQSNSVLNYEAYETAPLWVALNEVLRSSGASYGVGHLFADPDETFLAIAWDSNCWEDDGEGEWYDYASIYPLTTDPVRLGDALAAYAQHLTPITDVPSCVTPTLRLPEKWTWVYNERELLFPTEGLLRLQDPQNTELSRPMRKRRKACERFRDTSKFSILDIEDAPESAVQALLDSWLEMKNGTGDEVQTEAEYRILATAAGRAQLRDLGVRGHGTVLMTSKGTCLGFTYATEISRNMWTMIARVHQRSGQGIPEYVGEFLWREEAKHWKKYAWESDGGGSEGEDTKTYVGLSAQKYITLRAVSGEVREQGALVTSRTQAQTFHDNIKNRRALDEGLAALGLTYP